MRRLRTSYLDDWEDMEATDNPRVRILGVSVHPIAALAAMMGVVIVLMALLFLSRADWFPKSETARWSITAASVAILLAVCAVSVMSVWAMAKVIRYSRIHLAKLDGATDEEARQESERFIRRKVYLRLAVYAAVSLALWVVLGSPLIFDWGGPVPYLCGIAVMVAVFILYTSGQAGRIWGMLCRTNGR